MDNDEMLSGIFGCDPKYPAVSGCQKNGTITRTTSSDTALVAIAWQGQQRQQEKEERKRQGSKAPPHLRLLRSLLGRGHLADIQPIL